MTERMFRRQRIAYRGGHAPAARGFTLIETFVAITILLTAIAGPLTIASKGLSSALLARDQITAFYLAQDAIEYVRYKRDTNALQGIPWLQGLDACLGALCRVDSKEDAIAACGGACPPLRYNEGSGFFSYSLTDEETLFTRVVRIDQINADEVSLGVTVSWRTGIFDRSLTVREYLLNWQ